MSEYRVYCLTSQGSIANAAWVLADTVDDAVREARKLWAIAALEIWDGSKCVAKVPCSIVHQPKMTGGAT
jgi:hypothetical protein